MKNILFIALSGLMLCCGTISAQDGRYQIEGTTGDLLNGEIILIVYGYCEAEIMSDDWRRNNDHTSFENFGKQIFIDTAIIENGRFSFEGSAYTNHLASITYRGQNENTIFPSSKLILEPGIISVSILDGNLRATGTPLNDICADYQDSMNQYYSKINAIRREMGMENTVGGMVFPKKDTELGELFYGAGEHMINSAKENYSNPFGKDLLMWILDVETRPNAILVYVSFYLLHNTKPVEEIFGFVDPKIRNSTRFIQYVKSKDDIKTANNFQGEELDNFPLMAPDGSTKQLSDYIGIKDYVFIDFWASWCGPCLAEIPQLKEIYSEYSDNLEIISISLDTDRKSWEKAMETQNMPWPQLGDMKGYDSEIAKSFEIESIPFGVLVDREGVVIEISGAAWLKFFMEHQ